MKNVCKPQPKQRNYSNLMYCTQGEGLGWVGGVLNLSKSCRLLRVSDVYAAWRGQCFQWIYCICPSLLAHATHISRWWKGGWASSHEIPECAVDVLWVDLVKQRLLNSLHYFSVFYESWYEVVQRKLWINLYSLSGPKQALTNSLYSSDGWTPSWNNWAIFYVCTYTRI